MTPFIEVLVKFTNANIKYVVVGGLAVIAHGHNRLTGDVDVILDLGQENVEAALSILELASFVPRLPVKALNFADPEHREDWVNSKNMLVFSFLYKANPLYCIDLFVKQPDNFIDIFARSEVKMIDGGAVRIASIDDIIVMKKEAARPKDLEDVRILEIIKNAKG